MTGSFYLPLWYLATLLATPALYSLLRRFDLEPALAWTGSRTISLVVAATAAWGAAQLGMTAWPLAAAGLLLAGLLLSVPGLRRDALWVGQIARAEFLFLAAFSLVILLRLHAPEIRGTEKPLDFGILNVLIGTTGFPPPDFWLAGESLNYYYFGLVPWVIPIRLTGIPTEFAYNLAVASVGASVFSLAWAVARRLGASSAMGLLAGFLCTFSGTLDGVRQWAVSRGLATIDTWASSRQVDGAITEYPLFTTWLGDLHAHFTAAPMFLATLFLALVAFTPGHRLHALPLLAICIAAAVMANPWVAPSLAALVVILAASTGTHRPSGRRQAFEASGLAVIVIAGAAALAYPFTAHFDPPARALAFARMQTGAGELLLFAGVLLVPLGAGLYRIATRDAENHRARLAALWSVSAIAVTVAAVSGRPVLVVILTLAGLAAWTAAGCREPGLRSALWLSAVGLGLFAAPEIVVVRDDFDGWYRRANTVFKSYVQGWTLIGVALPVIMGRAFASATVRCAVIAAMLIVSVPHAFAVATARIERAPGLDGLRWMSEGDRAVVDYLRDARAQGVLLEAPGRAYEDAGRIAAATGMPGYLGWRRHERFWRGPGVEPELERRWRVADRLYSTGDVDEIRRLTAREGITLVVIGDVERDRYPATALNAIEVAGKTAHAANKTRVVRF